MSSDLLQRSPNGAPYAGPGRGAPGALDPFQPDPPQITSGPRRDRSEWYPALGRTHALPVRDRFLPGLRVALAAADDGSPLDRFLNGNSYISFVG